MHYRKQYMTYTDETDKCKNITLSLFYWRVKKKSVYLEKVRDFCTKKNYSFVGGLLVPCFCRGSMLSSLDSRAACWLFRTKDSLSSLWRMRSRRSEAACANWRDYKKKYWKSWKYKSSNKCIILRNNSYPDKGHFTLRLIGHIIKYRGLNAQALLHILFHAKQVKMLIWILFSQIAIQAILY